MSEIRKAAVIGAGVMGAGIAAHIANARVPVVLLDIAAEDGGNRSAIAEGAVEKMLKADPAPFMHKRNAGLVTTGNIEDDKIARDQGAVKDGYRIIANSGAGGGQHVPHFHVHIVAGRPLGRILAEAE